MSAQDDLLGRDDEEGYPVATTIRYFYTRDEMRALELRLEQVEDDLEKAERELRDRRPWWGKLRALLPGGKQA